MDLNDFRNFLGTPSYEDDNVLIYQNNSLELIRNLPENCLPLTVTSPPYNIGKEYESILSIEEYIEWMSLWIKEIYKCTLPNGAFWLNLGYLSISEKAKAIPIPYLIWDKVPL